MLDITEIGTKLEQYREDYAGYKGENIDCGCTRRNQCNTTSQADPCPIWPPITDSIRHGAEVVGHDDALCFSIHCKQALRF